MDNITRAYYEGQFKVAFLTAKSDAFQTLFEALMGKAHPADFIPCRPWGRAGDRKNDGYLPSERTLFQVYAPNEMSAADAIAKIDADFKGALPHWHEYFDTWVFVHNAHDGLSPQIIAKLLELESQYAPLKLTNWSLEELRQRLFQIPLDGLQSLFGFAPTGHFAPSTLPFVRVRHVRIYGTDTDPNAFSPSLREFEEQLVHRPVLAEQVEEALIERRFACLLGKGASGKTTLALLLAFSKPFGPEQSYYFDLAEADDGPEAAEPYRVAMQAIASQHGRDALVIVDNIHLAESLAQRLYLAWREDGQSVRLLLQGRFTQQGADRHGRLSPLEDLKRTALVLEVMPNDLAGVLQRLVRRADENLPVPPISPSVLGEWLNVYGGELIAFSSAVRRKLPQIVRGQYQLTEADAADFIRDEYLENHDPKRRIDSAERETLLAIAACAHWELLVPAEGLSHPAGPTVSARRGLVWQSTHGRFGQFVYYRLCHPGMAKLLWEAAKPATTPLDQACALAERSPFFGFTLANRLARVQDEQEATKRVLASAVSGSDAFERLVEHGMVMLHRRCQLLILHGILSATELDRRLVACRNLDQAALITPLHFLASFLTYAKTNMPGAWQALANTLADEKNRPALAQTALTTPLNLLANFLTYAENPMPVVWQALAEELADEKNRPALAQAALATPLGDLTNFLAYANTTMPEVWLSLASAWANEKNRAELAEAALSTPLHFLTSFLEHTKTTMPNVWQALAGALADEKGLPVLVQTALTTPLGNLASFLGYAKAPMPVVWQALAEALADKVSLPALVRTALTSPLGELATFLAYAKSQLPEVWQALAGALAEEKNRSTLAQTALTTPLDHLGGFLGFAKTRMPEVWQELADALADKTNRSTLTQTALTTPLDHLGGFLEYAKTPMPKVWQALADALADEKSLPALVRVALATDFGNLASFMVYASAAIPDLALALNMELAREFNASGVKHPRLQPLVRDPRALNDAERVLSGCGCRALAEELACRSIQAADLSAWHVRRVNLREVTAVLRLGKASDEPAMRRFLGQVVTEDWLRTQYQILPSQMVATALHVLWAYTPRYVCDHFLAFFPISRVEARLRFLHKAAIPVPAIPNLELLGASSLFNLDVCGTTRWWPPQGRLNEIAHHFSVGLGGKRLNSHQILFLAGLHEMVRHRRDFIRLAPEVGERILPLLEATASLLPNHQRLNAWLLGWLGQCAKHNWQLLKDGIPIPESVAESAVIPAIAEVSPGA